MSDTDDDAAVPAAIAVTSAPVVSAAPAAVVNPAQVVAADGNSSAGTVSTNGTSGNSNDPMSLNQLEKLFRQVKLTVPNPIPRLRIFSGKLPLPNGELNFDTWEKQIVEFMREPELTKEDKYRRVLSSLRCVARDLVEDCTTVNEILEALNPAFGDIKSGDELYVEFCQKKLLPAELPSTFILRMWETLTKIKVYCDFDNDETLRKFYQVIMKQLEVTYPLITLEMRTQLGFPGIVNPPLTAILNLVRIREVTLPQASIPDQNTAPRTKTAAVSLSTTTEEGEIRRLTERCKRLEDKLDALTSSNVPSTIPSWNCPGNMSYPTFPAPRTIPPSQQFLRSPRGPCFSCGVWNQHYARDCLNVPRFPPDPRMMNRRPASTPPRFNGSSVEGNYRQPPYNQGSLPPPVFHSANRPTGPSNGPPATLNA